MARPEDTAAKVNQEIVDIQKPRKVGNKVGLGVLHDDLQKVDKNIEKLAKNTAGKDPKENRGQLPITLGGEKLETKTKEQAAFMEKVLAADREQNPEAQATATTEAEPQQEATAETDAERTERLTRIGETIQGKIQAERGGTLNTTQTGINSKVYENFIEQTKQREELLKDATKEQIDIFKKLEETLIELREANHDDSKKLREQIADLGGQLSETEDTAAKSQLQELVGQTEQMSRPPTITGSIKEMFSGNVRAGGKGLIDALALKNETAIENRMGSGAPEDRRVKLGAPWKRDERKMEAAGLGGILKQLKGEPAPRTAGTKTAAAMPVSTATTDIKAAPITPGFPKELSVNNLTVNAKKVDLKGELKPAEEGEGEEGSMLGNVADVAGTAVEAKATSSMLGGIGGAIKTGGSKLLSSGIGKGGVAALGGLAMSYAGDKAKEAGYEKTGAGLDVAGQAAQWGGTGAMIGSVIPGVGTAIGAGVGAAAGGIYGLYKNWDTISGAKPQTEMVSTAERTSGTLKGVTGEQIQGHPNYKKYYDQAIREGASKLSAQEEASMMVEDDMLKAQTKAAPKTQGQTIKQQTVVNADLRKEDNKPVVVPVPTPVAAPAGQSGASVQLPRGNMRPTESTYDKYVNRTSKF